MTRASIFAVFLIACAGGVEHHTELGEVHAEPARDSTVRTRIQMRHHENDLREIERLLLHTDRIDEARLLAFWLERPSDDPRITAWPDEAARLAVAARKLAGARARPDAVRLAAQIAGACGACHERAGVRAPFTRETRPPPEAGARHEWAAERLFDGVVGASPMRWRMGLEVFAREYAGYKIAAIAERALDDHGSDRATTYGELRVACLTCHGVRSEQTLHAMRAVSGM